MFQPADESVADIVVMALAYRRFVLANPHRYQ